MEKNEVIQKQKKWIRAKGLALKILDRVLDVFIHSTVLMWARTG